MATTFIEEQEIKGGVIRNIDQATGDIARTTNGWIEDEKYGVYFVADATTVSGEFDSAVTQTGRLTGYIKTTNATGKGRFVIGINSGTGPTLSATNLSKYGIQIKPSTSYRLKAKIKYNNIASAVILSVHEHDLAGSRLATPGLGNLSGTSDWVEKTISFTSNASTKYAVIQMGAAAAGDAQEFWVDINSMTLEEVSTITNSGSTPALFYPKVTAVSSTDNIDQSQVVSDNVGTIGFTARNFRCQQFTPTKKNLTGIIIRRGANTGSYIGDVTFTLRTDNATKPSTTILSTVVIPNATWNAITADTDYTVDLSSTLTIGNTYWFVAESSTKDDTSNYTSWRVAAVGSYAGGANGFSADGTTWSIAGTQDAYFKTLYSKNTTNFTVRTDTETIELSTNPEGWEDGLVRDTYGINALKPLTLAPGVNNIYYSSNGSALADGEVDPSLQYLISGRIKTGGSGSGRKDGGYARMGDKLISKRRTSYGALSQF
jgi:hypothetical protein